MAREQIKEGALVRLKSGTEGWIKGQIVEYFDITPSVGGVIYVGPGYKVYVLEGKHKGETIRVPENYVEPIGHAKPGREPLYPHVPKGRQPLFPHVPKGRQPAEKLPQTLPQTGTCYEDAWRFLIKEEEGELIHGTLFSGGRRMGHAWVETPTGWVWEPETGKFFAASGFNDVFAPVIESRYTAEEAAIMAARTKNLGPWSGQERVQYLGVRQPQTKEKLYQRGPGGYPVGADKIMRDAWGPIPNPDQPFWSGKGFVKPLKIYGWQWSPDYHSWRAYVRFTDGTETWTSPREQTAERLPASRYEFFPESVKRKLPPTGATGEQKDPIVQVKFFTPWTNWTWYGIEFDGKDIFFGWVVGMEKEFGSFSLSELQSLKGPAGLKVERDIYFEPKPISQVMKEHGESLALPATIELLASTEGDPKGRPRKFCCRQCGECAPTELLAEGRFLDRISWLRSHYQTKHPGMWGKMSPMTVEDGELVSPEYRHLASLVREPLPKEAE